MEVGLTSTRPLSPSSKSSPLPRRTAALLAILLFATSILLALSSRAVPITISVPFSLTAISDTDLDGDPATGSWSDALSVVIPLENGAADPYGTATLYAKHDGTNLYFRIDGFTDVRWVSATGDHFWLGFVVSPTQTSHHGGGQWDGIFFGLWDETEYTPQPTYPPPAVDTNGFGRPPAKDALQNAFGFVRQAGVASPYDFTAEWRRPLNSGDANDLVYEANGVTTYNFFVTTDSDGGGSEGGIISHDGATNLNTLKFEPIKITDGLPEIVHVPPLMAVVGENIPLAATVRDDVGVSEVRINYTDVLGISWNESMNLIGPQYAYSLPAQNLTGTVEYFLWAADTSGNGALTVKYRIPVVTALNAPTLDAVVPTAPGCLMIVWKASEDPGLAGYRLYRWNTSRDAMEEVAELPEDATGYVDCNLEYDREYAYWVKFFDNSNSESPPSPIMGGRTTSPPAAGQDPFLYQIAIGALISMAAVLSLVVLQGRRPPPKQENRDAIYSRDEE